MLLVLSRSREAGEPGGGIVVNSSKFGEPIMGLVLIHPTLILASGSPRRDQMLSAAGFVFEVVPSQVQEIALPGEDPGDMAVRLGLDKAREVSGRVGPDRVVLGVDTVVAVGGYTLGKPADEAEAIRMLLLLSGRTHLVYSGYALVGRGFEQTGLDETRVTMRSISQEEAEAYSATGEPLDKAGAYGIQGEAIRFITVVDGSRSNVAGLPIEALVPLLASWGIKPERIDGDAPGRKDP